ncbi:MAG TPA: hypothetical protein VID29_08980 [Solirubrobacteraceae bacterium]|jgi:hypothetical protein
MQSYTIVLFGAVALFVVIGVLSTFTRGTSIYDNIGQGGFALDSEVADDGLAGAPGADPEREREIRQLVQARSDRRVRRGEAPLDIDAEVAKLAASAGGAHRNDPTLAGEVRQLVVARNERRARQGLDPLDVEDEVQRTLRELDPDH